MHLSWEDFTVESFTVKLLRRCFYVGNFSGCHFRCHYECAEVTKQTSIWLSSAFVQISAFVVCVLAWFITGRDGAISSLWHVSPKYMLLGGALGAFITYTVIYSINAIGPARSAMFIVSVQIVMSYLIELFGLFGIDKQPFEWRKCIGVAAIVAGIAIFKWK